jgi:hypothetical protein
VIVSDEAGLGMPAREWQSLFNKAIGYVLQSFRYRNLGLLITTPDASFIDAQARRLVHVYFECMGVQHGPDVVLAKPFFVEYNGRTGQTYMKYPRVTFPKAGRVVVKKIRFHKPDEDLRRAYERRRAAYMKRMYRELSEGVARPRGDDGVPLSYHRALLALRSAVRTDAELPAEIGTSRQWANELLRRARAAVKSQIEPASGS